MTQSKNSKPSASSQKKQNASWKEGSLRKASRYGATDEEQNAFARMRGSELIVTPTYSATAPAVTADPESR